MGETLVIAPHPDDECFGVGGTVAKLIAAGGVVNWIVYFSGVNCAGRDQYVADTRRSLGLGESLSIHTCRNDNMSDANPRLHIVRWIEGCVREFGLAPETVYAPSVHDLNIDHRMVAEAALVAFRPLPGTSVRRFLSYEVASATEWGFGQFGVFRPTVYEDITAVMVHKVAAVQQYAAEVREYPHPRSVEAVRAHAASRGVEAGVRYAEAFELVWERR